MDQQLLRGDQIDDQIDEGIRASVIETLVSKIRATYVIPATAEVGAATLEHAHSSGVYVGCTTGEAFAERVTADLRASTHDRHIALFYDPEVRDVWRAPEDRKRGAATAPQSSGPPRETRERFNFGFIRLERLPGNVGYLELRSFADLDAGRETASTYLSALVNFDAIILDLRQNGGGTTPMVAYVASYFVGPQPVHLTDMEWRDEGRTIHVWTLGDVPGRRLERQDLYLLVGPATFSAAEDFCYALRRLGRATLVGEQTAGGAHMGRGVQRLSPLFTAFLPTGRSVDPVTKGNWENVGVAPDVVVPAERALGAAHFHALRRLHERETDSAWRDALHRAMETPTRTFSGGGQADERG